MCTRVRRSTKSAHDAKLTQYSCSRIIYADVTNKTLAMKPKSDRHTRAVGALTHPGSKSARNFHTSEHVPGPLSGSRTGRVPEAGKGVGKNPKRRAKTTFSWRDRIMRSVQSM